MIIIIVIIIIGVIKVGDDNLAGQRLANAAISMRPAGTDNKARAKKLPRSADAKGSTAALSLSDPKIAQAGEHCPVRPAMRSVSQRNVGYSSVCIRHTSACSYKPS